jgi:hypothetical protein
VRMLSNAAILATAAAVVVAASACEQTMRGDATYRRRGPSPTIYALYFESFQCASENCEKRYALSDAPSGDVLPMVCVKDGAAAGRLCFRVYSGDGELLVEQNGRIGVEWVAGGTQLMPGYTAYHFGAQSAHRGPVRLSGREEYSVLVGASTSSDAPLTLVPVLWAGGTYFFERFGR